MPSIATERVLELTALLAISAATSTRNISSSFHPIRTIFGSTNSPRPPLSNRNTCARPPRPRPPAEPMDASQHSLVLEATQTYMMQAARSSQAELSSTPTPPSGYLWSQEPRATTPTTSPTATPTTAPTATPTTASTPTMAPTPTPAARRTAQGAPGPPPAASEPSPAVAALFGTLTTAGRPDFEPETPSASAALRQWKALIKAVCDINPYAAPHGQVTKACEEVQVRLETEGFCQGWKVARIQNTVTDLVELKEKATWTEWPDGQRVLVENRFPLDANGLTLLAAPLEKVQHLREEAQQQRQEKTGAKRRAEEQAEQRSHLIRVQAKRTMRNPHRQAKRIRKTTGNADSHVAPNSQGGILLVAPNRSRESSPLEREVRSEIPRRLCWRNIAERTVKSSGNVLRRLKITVRKSRSKIGSSRRKTASSNRSSSRRSRH
jgi:hypothetical protein